MATNIPPHNLGEVIDACVCLVDNPDATITDLLGYIKGPDFPTAGIINGKSGFLMPIRLVEVRFISVLRQNLKILTSLSLANLK